MMQRLIKGFLVCCFLLGIAVPAQASWSEARELVDGATQQMVKLLADPQLTGNDGFSMLLSEVDELLTPVVDFPRISRGVMAKHYRKASKAQRERFSGVFKNTLIRTYAKALAAFNFDRYEIVANKKPSKKPKKQTVKVDVFGTDGTRYSLIYFVLNGKNGWKVTNVHLDGINLRQIFKNQFADAVNGSKGNLDQVIDDWATMSDKSSGTES